MTIDSAEHPSSDDVSPVTETWAAGDAVDSPVAETWAADAEAVPPTGTAVVTQAKKIRIRTSISPPRCDPIRGASPT